MAKKLLDNKLLYVILSVFLAFCLYYYVTTVEGDTATVPVSGLTVTFEGEDILMDNGLMITSDAPKVTMTFRASTETLLRLNKDNITLTADVSDITEPGEYSLEYEPSYNNVSRSNFTVVDQSPAKVTVVVEEYVSREVEIRGTFTGQPADNHMIQLENNRPKCEFTPDTITISGLKSDVDKIDYALVTISNDELSETVSGDFPYELIGLDGEALDKETLDIECSTDTVHTILRVFQVAEIPLRVTFVDGGGATEKENVSWSIDPSSITVAGETADLQSLISQGYLSVATINLAEVEGDTTITCPIPLADELYNVDGVTEATVTITLSGLSTKTLEATSFTLQNKPDGYEAEVMTKSLNVVVRGTEEDLALVSAENLRVVVDLTDINLASGQYTVDAKVYFDGTGGAGVVGTKYPVVVRLTKL